MPVEPHVDVLMRLHNQLRKQIHVVHLTVERRLCVTPDGWQHFEERAMTTVRSVAIAGRVQISAAQPWLPWRHHPLMAAFNSDAGCAMPQLVPGTGLRRHPDQAVPLASPRGGRRDDDASAERVDADVNRLRAAA